MIKKKLGLLESRQARQTKAMKKKYNVAKTKIHALQSDFKDTHHDIVRDTRQDFGLETPDLFQSTLKPETGQKVIPGKYYEVDEWSVLAGKLQLPQTFTPRNFITRSSSQRSYKAVSWRAAAHRRLATAHS